MILVIDIGTTSVRVATMSSDGDIVGSDVVSDMVGDINGDAVAL